MHGLAVHAAVIKFQELTGRRFPTEATIHRVTSVVDGGEVVSRMQVAVEKKDTPESLANRVLPYEHEMQILFLKEAYRGNIKRDKRKEPLVKDEEEELLKQAINYAVNKYK